IYERDVPAVKLGQQVDVTVEAMPNEVFKGSVTFVAYQLDPQTRTLDARIEVKNDDMRLRPGMFADAAIRVPVVASSPPHASGPSTKPEAASESALSSTYQQALRPYLQGEKLLSQDTSDGVSNLLHDALVKLAPVKAGPDVIESFNRLELAV